MKLIRTILMVAILCLKFKFIQSINSNEESQTKYFQVKTNPKVVEELAVTNTNIEKSLKNIGKIIISQMKKNVCNLNKYTKLALCEQIVQNDNYGFKFDLDNKNRNPSCIPQNFHVQFINAMADSNGWELPMFPCPNIFYIDLETNEKIFWPYKYHISKAKDRHSAFLFFQKNLDKPRYPLKYVSNIAFQSLEKDYLHKPIATRFSQHEKVKTVIPMQSINKRIIQYIRIRQIKVPYQKFKLLLSSINVCTLPRSHKIHLCRKILNILSNVEDISVDGYDEEKCKNRRIHFINEEKFTTKKDNKLRVLHCPPPVLKNARIMNNVELSRIFLSSSATSTYVPIFEQSKEKGEKLRPKFYYDNWDTSLLMQDKKRAELLLYPSELKQRSKLNKKSSQTMEEELNLIKNPVQMFETAAKIKNKKLIQNSNCVLFTELIQNRWIVDDLMISFSKLKKNKLVYQRFQKAYYSVDLCQLTINQRNRLCREIFAVGEYFLFDENENIVASPCRKEEITLITREEKNLEINIFSMISCYPLYFTNAQNFQYYIGKSHVRDSAFILRSFDLGYDYLNSKSMKIIFPIAIITKIDRYALTNVNYWWRKTDTKC